jgi:hypothetical protein
MRVVLNVFHRRLHQVVAGGAIVNLPIVGRSSASCGLSSGGDMFLAETKDYIRAAGCKTRLTPGP